MYLRGLMCSQRVKGPMPRNGFPQELVTLGPLAEGRADPTNTGVHLVPEEFHRMLLEASGEASRKLKLAGIQNTPVVASPVPDVGHQDSTVVVDCRNIYETSIGHFDAEGVPLLDPKTRCFSDLPAWFNRVAPSLRGKRIMM